MRDSTTWRVLAVDDEPEMLQLIKEVVEDGEAIVDGDQQVADTVLNFSEALNRLEVSRYDVLILDVREGSYALNNVEEEAGTRVLEQLRRTRFLPIIFYTGLPNLVRKLENPPLIQVVVKGPNTEELFEAIRSVFESGLPSINRAIVRHVEAVQRDYMWEFVADNWKSLLSESDHTAVAYLLARRLAASLSGAGVGQLAEELGAPSQAAAGDDLIHPMQYYIMPPLGNRPMMTGDIYQGKIGTREGWWVVVTPSCDLLQGKADRVVLAACHLLANQKELLDWRSEESNTRKDRLIALLKDNRQSSQRDRYLYLPGALSLPDLIVDFQDLMPLEREELGSLQLQRCATLDSPFAEALTSQFSRLFGRIGTPDLDVEAILVRLRERTGD